MQVVGYMRAVPGVEGGRLYAQGEAIRAWARRSNARVVAIFQDEDGDVAGEGLQALMRSLSDQIDAVIVADASVLAADAIGQEIIRDRFRAAGVGIASADGDLEGADSPLRQLVCDILERQARIGVPLDAPSVKPEVEGLILEIVPDAANG